MTNHFDITFVNAKTVSCDGGKNQGHPLVYLSLSKKKVVACPYCSKSFTSNRELLNGFDKKQNKKN